MTKDKDKHFMKVALSKARVGIERGQTPFGACIVKDCRAVAAAHNRVWKNTDITAHAEILAIREACRRLKTIDLSGCTIYSTCEPCPMCFSACHWARVSRIVFGAGIADARKYGFNELCVTNARLKSAGKTTVGIKGGLMKRKAVALFRVWLKRPGKKVY